MQPWEFFLICSAVWLSPHATKRMGIIMGMLCILVVIATK
jgi:formate/nitrite transporter FocA (FNT family)